MRKTRTDKQASILIKLLAVWSAIFGIMLVTKSQIIERGVFPLISVVCICWLIYYTYVLFNDPTDAILKPIEPVELVSPTTKKTKAKTAKTVKQENKKNKDSKKVK